LRNKRIKPNVSEITPAVISTGLPLEPTDHSKKVDEIIKDLERQREAHKYKSGTLTIVQNINEFIFGSNPLKQISDSITKKDMYDEFVQCKMDDENKNNSDEEAEVPNARQEKGTRKSIIAMKSKNVFSLSHKKTLEDNDKAKAAEENSTVNSVFSTIASTNKTEKQIKVVFNDDLKKQILHSHELNEFLMRNSKFMERVIVICLFYSYFSVCILYSFFQFKEENFFKSSIDYHQYNLIEFFY